jgi:hypothetical protein
MKILDEKKRIGGEYLKERVENALHGKICRNPPSFERDLNWTEGQGHRLGRSKRQKRKKSGWVGLGRVGCHT